MYRVSTKTGKLTIKMKYKSVKKSYRLVLRIVSGEMTAQMSALVARLGWLRWEVEAKGEVKKKAQTSTHCLSGLYEMEREVEVNAEVKG